ncbi:MAG TPA: hypothetical protein V6D47_18760 [Oscillatoriaceae cyanobacterium]
MALAGDQVQTTKLDLKSAKFADVENNAAQLSAIRAIAAGYDPRAKIQLQQAVDRWAAEALDDCFKGSASQDESAALKAYHARMATFANRTDTVAMTEQAIRLAVSTRETKLQPDLKPVHQNFFEKVFGKITGVIGAIANVVSFITGETLAAIGWLFNQVFRGLGWLLGAAISGIGSGFDALGAHGIGKAFHGAGNGVKAGLDFFGKQAYGFMSGVGQALKDTFNGLTFMIEHPIMAVEGLWRMVRHPSTIWIAAQAMWYEACQGGAGHALGYMVGTIAPMFLSGGSSDGTLVGRLAHSSLLANTKTGSALEAVTMRVSNGMEVLRRASTFDIGGVVDGVTNFGKPLVKSGKGGSLFATTRKVAGAARHPIETARSVEQTVIKTVRQAPAKVGHKVTTLAGDSRTAWQVLRHSQGSGIDKLIAVQSAFQKAGETAAEAAAAGKTQAVADAIEAKLASKDLKTAFRALWHQDLDGFNAAIGNGADAVGKIQTIQQAINDISHVANAVGDVTNPGAAIEGKVRNHLVDEAGSRLSNNQLMTAMTGLHLNQEGVYAGDEARLQKDRQNGILKVLNPLG